MGGKQNGLDKRQNKRDKLIVFTNEEIRQLYECQKKNGDWTLYQEREFLENLQ
jgi:hypothetical protein